MTLSAGDGCVSEDDHGAHVEDGLYRASWRQGDHRQLVKADLGCWQWRWQGEKL